LQGDIQEKIPVMTFERHVNDPLFGKEVADLFINLMKKEGS
jgi:hypothetical protein